MLPEDENHVPKILQKKLQKERVENAMKNGGQRVAIDFTLSEDMSNKVSVALFGRFEVFIFQVTFLLALVITASALFIRKLSRSNF